MKSYKKILCIALIFIVILSVITGCAGNKPTVVRVVLDWTPNTNHTGLYAAMENGYFTEEGLEVRIIQPPENGALALLGAGKAEFAVTFQEELGPAIAAKEPLPITAVAALLQHNTSGLLSLAKSGITRPRDLAGKRVASWGTPFVEETMRYIVEMDGGSFDDVEMVFDEATDAISALQSRRIDAIWVYWGWDGLAAMQAGVACNYMPFIECDEIFDFYSPILAVNNGWLEKNPDMAKAFLRAVGKGYLFSEEYELESGDILLRYAPELDAKLVRESQYYLADYYISDMGIWGDIDPERWTRFYTWMYSRGLLERPLNGEGFTGEYLPFR